MTIGKGTGWGYPSTLPAGAMVHGSDRSLFEFVNRQRAEGSTLVLCGLAGGSLWSMLGGPSCIGRVLTSEAMTYPCDLVRVETDSGQWWFAGSLVARTRTWSRALLAMNVQNIGPYRFGHRAHPGDGLVDVYEAALPFQQRVLVAKRARLGAHLPHPGVREQRVREGRFALDRAVGFWLDGQRCGRSRTFSLVVEPDALSVVI